jgi:hypothetical protein
LLKIKSVWVPRVPAGFNCTGTPNNGLRITQQAQPAKNIGPLPVDIVPRITVHAPRCAASGTFATVHGRRAGQVKKTGELIA